MELLHQVLLPVPVGVGNLDPKLCCSYIFLRPFFRENGRSLLFLSILVCVFNKKNVILHK